MRVVRVALGVAAISNPQHFGDILADDVSAYYWDCRGVMWSIPVALATDVEKLIPREEGVLLESSSSVSITDLLALKTTFHTDDIIKLKENDLL